MTKNNEKLKKIFNQEVVSVVQEYFKCGFQVYNAHIYRTYNTKRNPGSPYNSSPYGSTSNWHHDGSSTDSLKLFLLVHDTKEIHGPMKFLNKTESMRALKKGFKFRNKNWNTILDNENKYRSLTGATGEMFLVDTNRCLHRAGEPQDQLTRDYLVIYLGSSKEEYDKKWYEIANRSDPWGFKRLSDAYNL